MERPGIFFNILCEFSIRNDNDQGFSLIESLIALIILGIIMAGGIAFFGYSNNLYYHGLHAQMATWVADSRLEKIKNAGCAQAPLLSHWGTDISTGTANYISGTASGITGLRIVTFPANCTLVNDVVVSVLWTEPGEPANSNQHSVRLETNVGP